MKKSTAFPPNSGIPIKNMDIYANIKFDNHIKKEY